MEPSWGRNEGGEHLQKPKRGRRASPWPPPSCPPAAKRRWGSGPLSMASAGARDVEARSPRRIRRPRGAGPFGGKIGQGREGESNIVAMSAHAGDAYVGFFLRAAVQVQGKDHAAFNEPIHKARPYLISDMV
jgi:hypothetical protein